MLLVEKKHEFFHKKIYCILLIKMEKEENYLNLIIDNKYVR